ncbi:PspC domain-containing protein [Flavobacterium sp. RHBU_3]|uniref:PspC domain-containing protein n=1 Tax=Flavobacterium sp. RHBU_3 TaxID=3391184 RepID=UPI003984C568
MNKTVSINLGGMFFHIDEDAYQKLNRYFDAIRRSLSPDGKDEIMSDIEARIAELLSEKVKSEKQVIGIREVEEVITVMGQPEDYRIDEEDNSKSSSASSSAAETFEYYRTKKFYRDEEKKVIGGVCAGLGHYFRIDPLWIRIIFILTLLVFVGTTSIVYVLLWILIPPAITTAEKLEMKGEAINISNIEKKVREEFDRVGDKIKNTDFSPLKTGAERVTSGLGKILNVLLRIVGAFIVTVSGIWLGALLVGMLVTMFATAATAPIWYPYMQMFNITGAPIWLITICAFFVVTIPVLGFFLLGLRILIPHIKPVKGYVSLTLVLLWFVSFAACVYFTFEQTTQYSNQGKTIERSELDIAKTDTLNIRFRYNSMYAKDADHHTDFTLKQDTLGRQHIYSNNIDLFIMKAEGKVPYVQIEKIAGGRSLTEAQNLSKAIKYTYALIGDELLLDNYLTTPIDSKWRAQKVEVYLYLPEGFHFTASANVTDYDDSDNDFFNLWYDSENHIYEMGKTKVYCLDCHDEDGNPVDSPFEDPNAPPSPPMSEDEINQMNKDMQQNLEQQAEDLKQQAEDMKEQARQMKEDAKNMAKETKKDIQDAIKNH